MVQMTRTSQKREAGKCVAQTSNLLYRSASSLPNVRRTERLKAQDGLPIGNGRYSGLEICATMLNQLSLVCLPTRPSTQVTFLKQAAPVQPALLRTPLISRFKACFAQRQSHGLKAMAFGRLLKASPASLSLEWIV
jgi:hypothetical protein